ncbi:cyclophilin-like fold protein [Paraburkholderia sp.]|uniref:cyclophilin-like fold protein n=1 Tax=Paraburkholderia sp. TaxID=1926495 RepID=UPI0039E52CD8
MHRVATKPITHKGILLVLLVTCSAFASSVHAASNATEAGIAGSEAVSAPEGAHDVNIRIDIGAKVMTATLDDNPTARDFASLLPLTMTLRDLSDAEKVSGALPRGLSEAGAPPTDAGTVGDIAYYAPWKNIAFYRGHGPDASGVIRIARITSGMEALNRSGQVRVTISRAGK